MRKIKGTLVILTLNEIDGVKAIIPRIPLDMVGEVFAVDGGSTDGTREFFKNNNIRVVNQKSKGRGEAFRIAIKEAKFDRIVFFSPDGNEYPEDITKMFGFLEDGYDMVIGSRFMKGSRCDEDGQLIKIRKFGNMVFTIMINFIFNGRLTDSINGFRGMTKKAFRRIYPDAHGFGIEFQMSIRALKAKFKIKEFPTIEGDRIGGKSTAGTFKVGSYFLRIILDEMKRKN